MNEQLLTLSERIAILETKVDGIADINRKLDDLLHLKSKGAGALWLVSIIVGSGILGLITTIASWFKSGSA